MNTLTIFQKLLIPSALFLVAASPGWLPTGASAQEKAAEQTMRLLRTEKSTEVNLAEGRTLTMSCPRCTDTWAKVDQSPGRGGKNRTATIQRHGCPGCETKIVTEGTGKQAHSVPKHVCRESLSKEASCCMMTQGNGPAKGIEPLTLTTRPTE